jgi:hypothetical protein
MRHLDMTKTNQSGQSLAEFSVALVVLVPLLLIVPLLGKYIDMNQAALQASRYVAWEKTVDPRTLGIADFFATQVGDVDMTLYSQWLQQNYGITLQ